MPVNFDSLCDFIDIFDDGPACMMCIFNIKNALTESAEPILLVISCYNNLIISRNRGGSERPFFQGGCVQSATARFLLGGRGSRVV
ncbi:hypothetical protein TNCV_324791 [Trichonephila clavipes]|nr:hypothetical protein TNCV_324791 [Trichonephila clavipes]